MRKVGSALGLPYFNRPDQSTLNGKPWPSTTQDLYRPKKDPLTTRDLTIVERVALPNYARKCCGVVQFPWELVEGSPSVVVRRLFRNASLVGYPRFFVSQARVFVVLGVLSRYWCCTVEVCVVFLDTSLLSLSFGPFVHDCEAERLFLCCVVRVGYWSDQLVVRSRVVASFFPTRALLLVVVREFVTRGRGSEGWLEDLGACGVAELREETLWRGAIPVGARGGFGVNQENSEGLSVF
ncbi:hypothetical protein Taro_044817 [Colocasia esculenta]|uniref:Uncharacterized protein n=1 Tax=Colocasia esculenta TaxID=4460 RepID=A0A843X5V2_COLES|nr:hypothetical protein [Colocasia esculenta]